MDQKADHSGHRLRMREQYARDGNLKHFSEHQVLELLLFYAIPQKDTNPLAHRILNHFGTLSDVFKATREELMTIKGVGAYAASLLRMIPDTLEAIRESELRMADDKDLLASPASAKQYARLLLEGVPHECLYLLLLSANGTVMRRILLSEGTSCSVSADPCHIATTAARFPASAIIIVHNHPGGYSVPSREDYEVTRSLVRTLHAMKIALHDHLVVGENDVNSMREDGVIDLLYSDACNSQSRYSALV